ncbi:MAG: phosphoglycerate kinase [Rhizobiaceae bacterium]|nr:MAG: phosphoglycerate kinase [Rhizobiaceae bacterium]CAG1016192.1 Phosphoglycerate kinase [Rhizobiaceae bacterium]
MTNEITAAKPLFGRTVLVRASFSSGMDPALTETVRRLTEAGARVAVIAGRGDPVGEFNPALSLRAFAEPLARAVGRPVHFIAESVGIGAEAGLAALAPGEVALMENLRFNSDARRAARSFALRLSALADYFVVTGPLPQVPANWIPNLQALLPEPPLIPHHLERESS